MKCRHTSKDRGFLSLTRNGILTWNYGTLPLEIHSYPKKVVVFFEDVVCTTCGIPSQEVIQDVVSTYLKWTWVKYHPSIIEDFENNLEAYPDFISGIFGKVCPIMQRKWIHYVRKADGAW